MRTGARGSGASVHAALAVFAVGLLATSVLFDVVGLATHRTVWGEVAYQNLLVGLAGTGVAALWAVIEVARTPVVAPQRPATLLRASAQVSALALFGGAVGVRLMDRRLFPSTTAIVLSAGGLALGAIGASLTIALAQRSPD
jgi:uncharacterized membrane protein